MEGGAMSKPHGIIIFGANGSGKTTLGRELAHLLNFKHIDIEDYAFEPSDVPYSVARTRAKCIDLMLDDIEKFGSFVFSTVIGNWGEKITAMYDLAVLLTAPIETRRKRVEQRSYERHGERVRIGGDMYEREQKFIDFVATRQLEPIEQWAETLVCSVIRIDGTDDYKNNAAQIAEKYLEIRL
jgi:adenylate kinase family enzyme